ncbi:hypothetical protein [Accumulibacter sp.]|uniref:hypothetical protein n=1 Tax=Accumulibacter sp. TaxID=2053492 RepID=UPI002CAD1430|nr:hypothetical protein [Accumulibacter sp.]HNG14895.1 hypothetical protein [Accumulibacter sp.]
MNADLFAVYGASGCGWGVMPIAEQQLRRLGVPSERRVVVDDRPSAAVVNGRRVLAYQDHAYIGSSAVLKQGRPGKPLVIGWGAVVGVGAVVRKDVAPGATVVGNPATLLVKV